MARVHVVTLNMGDVRVEQAMFREWLALSERRHDLVMRYSPGAGFVRYADGRLEPWKPILSEFTTRPIDANRNKIVVEFLADEAAEFLLMIDSDQMPQFNPLDYVDNDFDILGWPYPTSRVTGDNIIPWFPCEPEPGDGVVKSEVIGTGCILIARRVFEHPALASPFRFDYHENGTLRLSEDYGFCIRAREAGFTVWADLDHWVLHWKTAEMRQLWKWSQENGLS